MRILVALLAGLALSLPASGDGIEHTTSFAVEGAYYLPDHKGYGVPSGGFAPISYSPVEVPGSFVPVGGDQGRSLGSTWGPGEIQVLLSHKILLPFLAGQGLQPAAVAAGRERWVH